MADSGVVSGICQDCGRRIEIGAWPFACEGKGHALYMRLAILGKGRTREFDPPMPLNPIKKPVVTRDWLSPDGTLRPMPQSEWVKEHAVYVEPGVQI